MRQIHRDLLFGTLASFGVGVIGVIGAWVAVGPSQLSTLIFTINIPLHVVGGIIVMTLAIVLRIWVLYPGLRRNPVPFTKELTTVFVKVLYLFLLPLMLIGHLLISKERASTEIAQYYIGVGLAAGIFYGLQFLTALLAELWMLIRHKD